MIRKRTCTHTPREKRWGGARERRGIMVQRDIAERRGAVGCYRLRELDKVE